MRRPAFIAKQSGKPTGWIGHIVAPIMAGETATINREALAQLEPGSAERVLDVGCGNGLSLKLLASDTDAALAVGVDHSPVMCARATRHNAPLIAAGRVRVVRASSDDMPFENDFFDAAMSIHTLYFWQPAGPHIAEIARVLQPGGRLVLAFRPDDDAATADFPDSVYTFRTAREVADLVAMRGFGSVRLQAAKDGTALLSAVRQSSQ